MVEMSDLLTRDMLVLRATAPPNAQFNVLDERGRRIGRVVEEDTESPYGTGWLVVYDREKTRVLASEQGSYNSDGQRQNPLTVIDGRGRPITEKTDWRGWLLDASGQRIGRLKRGRKLVTTIKDPAKTEVGRLMLGRPPDGDHLLGVTFVLTITADTSDELRLAALGYVVNLATSMSGTNQWLLKQVAKGGSAWPGSAGGPECRWPRIGDVSPRA